VHHDDGRAFGAKLIGHFDDAASVIGKPPGADVQVGVVIVDEQWRFEAL
jgi:hypothetical protein